MRGSASVRTALAAVVMVALSVLAGCGLGESREGFALRIAYQALPVDGAAPSAADMEVMRQIVESRLEATGVAALRVTVEAPDIVVVEASPAAVVDDVRSLAGVAGRVDFVPLGDTQMSEGQHIDLVAFPPLFSGDQVADASVGSDQTGHRTVDFVLRDQGRQLLADYTRNNIGTYLAIVLDGLAISVPVIMDTIAGGEVQISTSAVGGFTLLQAQRLVTILQFGQLPFPLQEVAYSD
jgi:preprotein translocase subunit SecD